MISIRTLWLVPVLAAVLITSSCSDLLSVEPLASDSNTVFDPTLLGVWGNLDGSNSTIVTVREGEKHHYDILWIDAKDNENYRLDARLVELGGQRILDVSSNDTCAGAFSIPGHAFLSISDLENGLKIQFLDSEWMQENVRQSKSLAHYELEDHPVITGTTAQLQNFFLQFGLRDEARSEPVSLRRLSE